MANEYTLADYERLAPTPLAKAVIRTWREASPIMDSLNFKEDPVLQVEYMRINEVPQVPWRNIGDSFTQVKVEPEILRERPYFIGAKIDIPKEYVIARSIVDQRAIQEEAIVKGIAFGFNESFINGVPADQKEPIGLWYRLKNDLPSDMTVAGGGYDISPDTAVTDWQQGIIDLVEDFLSRFEMGTVDALIMNRQLKLRFQAALRWSGLLSTTVDQIGRKFETYGEGGPRLIDAGYAYDLTTQIIGNVQSDDGNTLTGGDATSMFGVKLGEPYLDGFCEFGVNVDDVGLLEDRVNYRTVVDWAPGFYMVNPRSVGRLVGIVAA